MAQRYRTAFRPCFATVSPPILCLFFLISLLFCLETTNSEQQSDCVEVICPLEENGTALRLLDAAVLAGGEQCERCEQCTRNEYSVCSLPVQLNWSTAIAPPPNLSGCECAHSGPNVRIVHDKKSSSSSIQTPAPFEFECRLPTSKGRPTNALKPNPGEGIVKLCFSSAIQKLPKPKAKYNVSQSGNKPDLLVTIEPFWLSDYWRALKPSELKLFYIFPVTRKDNCEAQVIVANINQLIWLNAGKSREKLDKQNSSIWLCRASLSIDISGGGEGYPLEESAEEGDGAEGGERADNTPPEVLFEHDVFVGAEKVQLYYEVAVQRENLLKMMSAGRVKFETRKTELESEPLYFELGEEQYKQRGPTDSGSSRTGHGTSAGGGGHAQQRPRVDRVDIEQRKATPQGERRTPSASKGRGAEDGGPATLLLLDTSTAVPAPPGSVPTILSPPTGHRSNSEEEDPSSASILETPSSPVNSRESGDRTEEQRVGPAGAEQSKDGASEEDWKLLHTVLIISLGAIAVLFVLALCYKKRLCCFGGSSQGERNGKTRNVNGKQYRETGQRLK